MLVIFTGFEPLPINFDTSFEYALSLFVVSYAVAAKK